jgi:hypothetical protein
MKIFNFLRLKLDHFIFLGILVLITTPFSSCSSDDENTQEAYFEIVGAPTQLSAGIEGAEEEYLVRAHGSWEVVPQTDADWVRAFPNKGEDDGIFRFIVKENLGFENRSVDFKFFISGVAQPTVFTISQQKNAPFLEIEGGTELSALSDEQTIIIPIKANVDWSYSFGDVQWLDKQEGADGEIKVLVKKNIGPERMAVISISSTEYPDLSKEVKIIQSSGNVIFEENFNWLTYGTKIPYVTDGEKRFDSWTPEELAMGWISSPNEASKDQPVLYARNGFVKLGKTGYGGDFISPKLTEIEDSASIKVTFKAAGYISAGGTKDDNILRVSPVGPGETDISVFEIDNYPNSKEEDDQGVENNIWDPARAFSFTVTGATAETQIRFLSNKFELKGVGKGKNRIFLDDIKIEIIVP